jgi:hypothetical protein
VADEFLKGAEKGLRGMATRSIRMEETFLRNLERLGGITREEAVKVLAVYRKARVLREDRVNGVISVKHGSFLDRHVIRKALEQR